MNMNFILKDGGLYSYISYLAKLKTYLLYTVYGIVESLSRICKFSIPEINKLFEENYIFAIGGTHFSHGPFSFDLQKV